MNINKNLIKHLREITKASYIDCLNALKKTNDILIAKNLINKNYLKIKFEKKLKNFGLIKNYIYNNIFISISIKYETDFIENNNYFKNLTNKILYLIIKKNPKNIFFLKLLKYKNFILNDQIKLISKNLKESISIDKFIIIKTKKFFKLYKYNNKTKILLIYTGEIKIIKDICIQIIYKNIKFISLKSINYNLIKIQYNKLQKKNNLIQDKLIIKYLKNLTLKNQNFIKKKNLKIKNLLKKNKTNIISFILIKI